MCITIIRIVHLEECYTFFIFNLITLYGEKMFYTTQGGLYELTELDYNSTSVGKFSISKGTANANPKIQPFTINGRQVSPKIRELLMGTGLLYAGVKGV